MTPIYEKDGVQIFRNFFLKDDLAILEEAVEEIFAMQAKKIRLIYNASFPQTIAKLENAKAIYAMKGAQRMLQQHPSVSSLFNIYIAELCKHLKSPTGPVLYEGFTVMPKPPDPNWTRLIYGWHSQRHHYPKRRDFLNVWFPLFGDRSKENGCLSVKLGSHVKQYEFADFYENDDKANWQQYEVPDQFHAEFPEFFCETKRGDCVIFKDNLIHRGNINRTKEWAFSGALNVWNPANDLTLSGQFYTPPYAGDDRGAKNMDVKVEL